MTDQSPLIDDTPITVDIEPHGPSPGQIGLGVVLVAIGVVWFLAVLGVLDEVPWTAMLAGGLIAIGALLMALSGSGRHGALIVAGFVMAVILGMAVTVENLVDVPFSGGIGETSHTPGSVTAVDSPYRLAIGDLTVDLDRISFPQGTTEIEATVAIGHLLIEVPDGVALRVVMTVGAGEAVVDAAGGAAVSHDGLDVDEVYEDPDYATATVRLELTAGVGLGQVEVRR